VQAKDFIAASLLLVAACGGMLVATLSYYARALMFVALVAGAVLVDMMGVEFLSLFWYRGTTRGFEMTLLDVLALSVLVGSLVSPRHPFGRWYWPAGIGLLAVFIAYAAGSVLLAEPYLTGMFELHKMVRGVVVLAAAAAFVRTERELQFLVFALGAGVFIETLFGLKQRYWNGMDRVDGTVFHPNTLSMYLCMVTPVLAAAALARFPHWLRAWCGAAVGAAAVCILLTVSRAGIPIFAVTLLGVAAWCLDWRITVRKLVVTALIFAGGALVVRQSWDTLVERFTQASLQEEYLDPEKEGRGVYLRWAKAILDDHPHGVGLNNWSYYVSRHYGPQFGYYYEDYGDFSNPEWEVRPHAAPAHNLFALTAGELGYAGGALFLVLWLRWLQLGSTFLLRRWDEPMHRIGVGLFFGTCGIFLQSMTEWTYRQTVIFFTFSTLMGVLASLVWARRHVAPALAMRSAATPDESLLPLEPAGSGRWST
jgi:O-antigen ligase